MPDTCMLCKKSRSDFNVSLFKFPTKTEDRKAWLKGLSSPLSPEEVEKKYICSEHFDPSMIRGEKRKVLQPNALPHPRTSINEASLGNESVSAVVEPEPVPSTSHDDPETIVVKRRSEDVQKINRLEKKLRLYQEDPPAKLIFEHREKLREFADDDIFDFFDDHVRNFQRKARGKRFSDKTKILASKLFYGFNNYRQLSKILKLPSTRTIKRFNSDKTSRAGWCPAMEKILENISSQLSTEDKTCVLAFDETEMQRELTYNRKSDIVDGYVDLGHLGRRTDVAEKVLVFVLRGLFGRWKQAITYYFTWPKLKSSDLKAILVYNIRKVLGLGFNLIGVVSDGDAKNRKSFSDLGATVDNPVIMVDGKRIVTAFDVPHILKNIRNNLLVRDMSVEFPQVFRSLNGSTTKIMKGKISWSTIEKVLKPVVGNEAEILSKVFKITSLHLRPTGYEKMKVKLAAQIFSHSVSSYMLEIATLDESLPEDERETIKRTAFFIALIDRIFDVLNSSTKSPRNGKPWAKALTKESELLTLLEDFIPVIDSIEFDPLPTGNNPTVYSKDMLKHTIKGVLIMANQCFEEGIESFYTRRLSTDSVENYFAQLKLHLQYISPRSFQSFFNASLILRSLDQRSTNCEADEDEVLLTVGEAADLFDTSDESSESSAEENELVRFINDFNPSQNQAQDLQEYFENFDPFSDENSFDEKLSLIAYFAGYLVRRIKKDENCCDECLQILSTSERQSFHSLTQLREYNEESESLCYPSEKFVTLVKQIVTILTEKMDTIVFTIGTKNNLQKLLQKIGFDLFPDCHRNQIKLSCIKYSINTLLNQFLKRTRLKLKISSQKFDIKQTSADLVKKKKS